MNSTHGGQKKPAVCRYFANSGTCYFGNECQFLHSGSSTGNDLLTRSNARPGSHSPGLDPLFQAFAPTGLPPESKLQTYINATPRSSIGNEKSKSFIPSSANDVANAMASITLDGSRKTPVMTAMEFVPMSNVVNSGRLTHSMSSPSFSQYNMASGGSTASTPFGRFGSDANSGCQLVHIPSPVLSPQHSPLMGRRNNSSPLGSSLAQTTSSSSSGLSSGSSTSKRGGGDAYGVPLTGMYQESVAGTTYFYASDDQTSIDNGSTSAVLQDYRLYPGNPSHIEHMKPKANAPSFFLPDELRMDILHRIGLTMAQPNPDYLDFPSEVDNYHNLCPLENYPSNGPTKSATFGYITSVYKAINTKTGIYYCLRRIHGFRLSNTKCMQVVDMWKKLQHSNLVHLREVFTTKAFGDHSIVFVYDYHAGADTLMNQYFGQMGLTAINGYAPSTYNHTDSRIYSQNKSGLNNLRQHAGLLPESLIWAYIVQLSSALRTIHAAGLACRALDPTKIVITGKSRLRLNCCGAFDVLSFDANQQNTKALTPHFQQEDLVAFGKVVLGLACNSLAAVQRENLQTSLELVARNYSADLRNLILYLLSNQTRSRNINDIMPMIGARFYTQLDAAQMRSDVIENELAKEVENGRLYRLLVKLGTINERPEFNLDPSWSETGDRYLLKLFRDYLFHQVTEDGRPWLDIAHIVQCLNKLDAGVSEKICLMSRDEQNVLVVSYAELKQYFESSFGEILQATALPKTREPS